MPISLEKREEIEGCCCSEGSVQVKLDINKSGFVPGEPLVYDINIDNKSDNTIETIHLILEQVIMAAYCSVLICLQHTWGVSLFGRETPYCDLSYILLFLSIY